VHWVGKGCIETYFSHIFMNLGISTPGPALNVPPLR